LPDRLVGQLRVHGHGDALPRTAGHHRDRLPEHGTVHVPRPPVGVHRARLDGLLRGRRLMETGSDAAHGCLGAGAWRFWALLPIVVLAGVVSLFAATGGTLLDLVGRTPPPLDQFEIRRVEFKPGEVRVRVTNPQRAKLTVAAVTVDDAIVP